MTQKLAAVALVGLVLSGCGGESHELEVAPVKGKVLLNGKALQSGFVLVVPPKGRMAKGVIQEDGSFELTTYDEGDGAPVGTHMVMVKPLGVQEGERPVRSKIPSRYGSRQSGLKIVVSADQPNTPVIELTTK